MLHGCNLIGFAAKPMIERGLECERASPLSKYLEYLKPIKQRERMRLCV